MIMDGKPKENPCFPQYFFLLLLFYDRRAKEFFPTLILYIYEYNIKYFIELDLFSIFITIYLPIFIILYIVTNR